MQTEQIIDSQSGSLLDGNAASYDFVISEVFQEAWQRTSGFKTPVLVATMVIFLGLAVLGYSFIVVLGLLSELTPTLVSILSGSLNFMISIATYPIVAGVLMMGLYRAVDAPVHFKMAFAYFAYSVPIIIAIFCISILVMLGFALLIIPDIYLSVAYVFTLLLIIEKNMDFWQAMETSRKAVHQHWLKVFFTYLLMGIIYIISIIPFGIGLIWAIPLFVALQGVLYRRIFGINSVPR